MTKLLLAIPVLIDDTNILTECLTRVVKQTSVKSEETDVYVIVNNEKDESLVKQVDNFDDGFVIINQANFGVAGSWNQAILEAIKHKYKYVACMGYDVMFEDDRFLENFIEIMDLDSLDFADTSKILFNFWMANAKSFRDKIGLFDENFYPGYWEDLDILIRMDKATKAGFFNKGRYTQHGIQIEHLQSKTINDHEEFIPHDVWNYSYTKNQMYLKGKWNVMDNKAFLERGGPPPETFEAPFNNEKLHYSFWIHNIKEIRKSKEKWDACLDNHNKRNENTDK